MSQPAYRVVADLPEVRLDRVVHSFEEASQAFVDWLESLPYHRTSVHCEVFEVQHIYEDHYESAEEGTLIANVLHDGLVFGHGVDGQARTLYARTLYMHTPHQPLTTEPIMIRTQVHLHIERLLAGALKAVEGHRLEGELIVYDLTYPQLELIRRICSDEIVRSVFHGTRQHEFEIAHANARTAAARLVQRNGVEEVQQDEDRGDF